MSRGKWAIVLAALALCVVLIAGVAGARRAEEKRHQRYQQGLAAEEVQNWAEAAVIWAGLGTYRDSCKREIVTGEHVRLEKARAESAEGSYFTAETILKSLLDATEGEVRTAAEEELKRLRDKRAKLALERAEDAYREAKWAVAVPAYEEAVRYNPELGNAVATSLERARASLLRELRAAEQQRERQEAAAQRAAEPAPYRVRSAADVSIAGRSRTALRMVIQDKSASAKQVHAALLEAAKSDGADKVMVFAYWPGDDTTSIYTAGRLEWGKDGRGWDGSDYIGPDGRFDQD